jgi:hypothetical protein
VADGRVMARTSFLGEKRAGLEAHAERRQPMTSIRGRTKSAPILLRASPLWVAVVLIPAVELSAMFRLPPL